MAAVLLDMEGKPFVPEVVDGDAKLTKSGRKKHTPNNYSVDRWVDPIRNVEDIDKIKKYFDEKIRCADTLLHEQRWAMKRMVFICGINWGLRVSDLVNVKWEKIFESDDGEVFLDWRNVKEEKTGKIKRLYCNESVQNTILDYINRYNINHIGEDFVFTSSQSGGTKPISDTTVGNMIKDACKECGIKGNYYTHSLRKTYAYQMYMALERRSDPLALPKVQKMLNHRNQSDTLKYLGLQYQMEKEMHELLCL